VSAVYAQQPFAAAQRITSDRSVCMNTAEGARLKQRETAFHALNIPRFMQLRALTSAE
jgi:hypothetical protein